MKKIRVLVVDDSVVIRRLLTDILNADAEIEVPVARLERRSARGADHEGGALRVRAIDAGAERRPRFLDDTHEGLGEEVRVDVDAEGLGHG